MKIEELIDTYCAVWSAVNDDERAILLHRVWAEGANYIDPTVSAHGAAELLSHIQSVRRRRPGSRVLRISAIDMHHGMARFEWRAIGTDGIVQIEGLDLAFVSSEARTIERIIGFFGRLAVHS